MAVIAESDEHIRRINRLMDVKNWDAVAHERFNPGSVDIEKIERGANGHRPKRQQPTEWPTLDELYTDDDPKLTSSLHWRTAQEIAAETPAEVDWTIHGIAANRSITEIVASIKAGKSTFIGHAVAAVLHGQSFLGYSTHKGPVLWLTEERPTTFRRLLERTGLLSEQELLILTLQDARGASWPDMVTSAVARALQIKAVLLVVDTIGRMASLAGDSENDAGAAQAAMAPLENAAASGLAVILGRHARKAGGDPESVGRGSSAWSGISDIVIQLTKPGASHPPNVRRVNSVSRFEETPDEVLIQLDEDGYKLLGSEAAVALGEAETAILEGLELAGGELLQTEIFKLQDRHEEPLARRTVQRALANLSLFHRVERLGAGGRRDPLRFTLISASNLNEYHGTTGVILTRSEVEMEAVIPHSRVSRPYTEGATDFPDTLRKPCPNCHSFAFSVGPDGPPQRRCHGCSEVWTP